jgi:hypothetical protein
MAESTPSSEKPLRMSVEAFRARREAREPSVVLDVRGPKDWDLSDARIPGALRAYPEIRIDPNWPRDRLILTYLT